MLACAACGGDDTAPPIDAPALPAWQPGLPPSSVMGEPRGMQRARGIIHLHSPYSHDACDGDPRPGGGVDEACLADLRAALCTTRMDYAALTDHDDSMADEDFDDLFVRRDGDTIVNGTGGTPIAARLACPDGPGPLITVGTENPIMAVMLDTHVPGNVAERHAVYNGDDPATVAALRAAGALVWIPHTEQRTTAELLTLDPDGLEIYQLHANIDPDIRRDHLGLEPAGAISAVLAFADTSPAGPEPDLALLSFLLPSGPALQRWDDLLAAGRRVSGSGGTDAHQNALPLVLRDGERGDSYRRMIRWFNNVALVADRTDPAQIEAALDAGRMFVLFEVMGTPVGLDVRATTATGVVELGGEVSVADEAVLEIAVPTVHELPPMLPRPVIRTVVQRIDGGGRTEVLSSDSTSVRVPLDRPGAFRVEFWIRPHHHGPYLGNLGTAYADTEHPWIYTSPIYVNP
jgi:hypothetical protein